MATYRSPYQYDVKNVQPKARHGYETLELGNRRRQHSVYFPASTGDLQPQSHQPSSFSQDPDMPQFTATFVPGGVDDYYPPEVVAPSPQRVTPQVPQNMQGDLERMELEAREQPRRTTTLDDTTSPSSVYSSDHPSRQSSLNSVANTITKGDAADNFAPYQTKKDNMSRSDAPSFSPFPKVQGDNVPPSDEEKEEILWKAREHVLHSNNVSMQLSWARDVLALVEIVSEAHLRELDGHARPPTPKVEHTLRLDAVSIVDYLSSQDHPEAMFMKSKWLEFGKFNMRQDRKEAYNGYKRAAALGYPRAEYRMGMLFESSNDYSAAVEHYYSGLQANDSAASYRLGMMSLLGQHGQPKDYQRGLKLIRDAADSADEDAPQGAYVYGMLLSRELPEISVPESILPSDMPLSKMYLEKAAYLGFAKAQLKMGQAYELCQLSCDFNPAYSVHYYGLASKQGQPEAALGVSRWFLFGYEGIFNKNEQLAFKYAQDAANAKLATGEFAMGYYYEIGIHVAKDLRQARNWYEQAAENGNKDAAGRLESLSQSKSLSKTDHETTTLTRIKSQHGSKRGKRPERFKQNKGMPTLDENNPARQSSPGVSPRASPRVQPTTVQDGFEYPGGQSSRPPAFGVNVDTNLAIRSKSAVPYPEDDRPPQQGGYRSQSTAPYPEDDVAGGRLGVRSTSGPQADRPHSAFGVRNANTTDQSRGPYGPSLNNSQSMAHLVPAGADPRGPSGGYRQANPGPGGYGRGPGPGGHPAAKLAKPNSAGYGRPPPGPGGPGPGPGPGSAPGAYPPAREYGQPNQPPQPNRGPAVRPTPPPGTRPERFDSAPVSPASARAPSAQTMPLQGPRPGTGSARPDADPARVGSAPPSSQPRPGPAGPPKPTKQASQGPATFEEMGIPQGKGDDQCVVM